MLISRPLHLFAIGTSLFSCASATSLRSSSDEQVESSHRLLGWLQDQFNAATAYLPDFDFPDRGDFADTASDTLCNNGIAWGCDQPQTGQASKCTLQAPLPSNQFNMNEFLIKTWYVQKMQEYPLLSKKQMNCVLHTYDMRSDGYISAYQYANDKKVGGTIISLDQYGSPWAGACMKPLGGGNMKMGNCGSIVNLIAGNTNLYVNPFDAVSGPYWVLAVGPTYEWAIVSGGQVDVERKTVKVKSPSGGPQIRPAAGRQGEEKVTYCTTPKGGDLLDLYSGSGLFLMTRDPVPDPAVMFDMMETLKEKRIWAGDLVDVDQVGCDYNGARIKNGAF